MTRQVDQHNQGLVDPLEELFAQARGRAVEPSADFLGRLLEEAYAEQPTAQAAVPERGAVRRAAAEPLLLRWLRRLAPSAGLATAVMAGFWVGFTQPAALMAPVSSLGEVMSPAGEVFEMVDLIPSLEGWPAEG